MTLALLLGFAAPLRSQGARPSTGSHARETRALLALMQAAPDAALPPSWRTRAVRGAEAPSSRVVDSAGVRYLRIAGDGTAAWFVHEVEPRIAGAADSGRLQWRWRAPVAPRGADLRALATDDSPLRVFVAFGPLRRFGGAPRTIFYTLGGAEPPGFRAFGHRSDDSYVVRMGASDEARDWVEVTVDPFADYERAWGEGAPPIAVVGLLHDVEQTGTRGVADIAYLRWFVGPGRP